MNTSIQSRKVSFRCYGNVIRVETLGREILISNSMDGQTWFHPHTCKTFWSALKYALAIFPRNFATV